VLTNNAGRGAFSTTKNQIMIHIIYTHKGKVKQAFKEWTPARAERVLERLGATYWEIGI
jgi:hypothetical protein